VTPKELTMKAKKAEWWISELSQDHLLEIVQGDGVLRHFDLATQSIDRIGNRALPLAIDGAVSYGIWPDYWEKLKREFRLLLCTKDKKYNMLRKELGSASKKSQTAIVSTIAVAMASQFGVVAGVLVPFCALCLIALSRLGKEAFCASQELRISPK
jgi:hypothetical protein